MSVSNIKAFLLLAFVLVNCEFGFSRPHPENFKKFARRELRFSNPIFNSVFRNRHPEQGLMKKFLGEDGSNNDNYQYVIQIPINDNNSSDYSVDQNEIDHEVSVKVIDGNSAKNSVEQEKPTEVISQNTDQSQNKQDMSKEVMGQNPDQNPILQETSTGVTDQNQDQNPIKQEVSIGVIDIRQETSTGVTDQKPDQNPIKQKTSTEVIDQNPDENPTREETSTGVVDQKQAKNVFDQVTSTGVTDQNPDQKPFTESLQVSGDLEAPAQAFIVVADEVKSAEPVALNAVEKDDQLTMTNAANNTTGNRASKKSKGCVPRFQSEIAIEEQKMLTYFMNLVEPQANQNTENGPNPCPENETFIDTEKSTPTNSAENSYINDKDTPGELTNELNFDKKPAPITNQPNTLVRGDEVDDYFFLFEDEDTVKNSPQNEANNVELEKEKVKFPSLPIIPDVSNGIITDKNQSNPDISSTKDAVASHVSDKASNNDLDENEDFDIGYLVPIIHHTPTVQIYTTPNKPQRNPEMSFKIYEPEISYSKEKQKYIEKTTRHPVSVDVKSDTTLKPQLTSPGSESEDNKRLNRSTNLPDNITKRIGHHNYTIKTLMGKGFISGNIKFIENTKSGPTDKSSTIGKYIQKHHRNLTNQEIQKFANDVLQLWDSNQISGNRKTLSTNKPNVRVNKNRNYKRPNSNVIKQKVSASGLEITEPRHGTAVPKRGTPVIRRGTAVHRRGTSAPTLGTNQDGLLTSILSRILQAVLRSDYQTPNIPKRVRRDLGLKKNKYVPKIVLKSIARKFFAPKYFPRSSKNVFAIPGGSAVETLPANFRQGNYELILRNLVDSDLERKEVITLADIFNSDYLRKARSNKLKDYSEEFEQIM